MLITVKWNESEMHLYVRVHIHVKLPCKMSMFYVGRWVKTIFLWIFPWHFCHIYGIATYIWYATLDVFKAGWVWVKTSVSRFEYQCIPLTHRGVLLAIWCDCWAFFWLGGRGVPSCHGNTANMAMWLKPWSSSPFFFILIVFPCI